MTAMKLNITTKNNHNILASGDNVLFRNIKMIPIIATITTIISINAALFIICNNIIISN